VRLRHCKIPRVSHNVQTTQASRPVAKNQPHSINSILTPLSAFIFSIASLDTAGGRPIGGKVRVVIQSSCSVSLTMILEDNHVSLV
jgi:hypothetical protein